MLMYSSYTGCSARLLHRHMLPVHHQKRANQILYRVTAPVNILYASHGLVSNRRWYDLCMVLASRILWPLEIPISSFWFLLSFSSFDFCIFVSIYLVLYTIHLFPKLFSFVSPLFQCFTLHLSPISSLKKCTIPASLVCTIMRQARSSG